MNSEQKRRRDDAAEAFATDPQCRGVSEWQKQAFITGFDQGFAEGRACGAREIGHKWERDSRQQQAEIERLTSDYNRLREDKRRLSAGLAEAKQIANERNDTINALDMNITELRTELAKREGELHMNSDFNVEKLHMNSKAVSPAHAHEKPGIWDSDNGDKAGSICELCYRWNAYEALKAENERLSRIITERHQQVTELKAELDVLHADRSELAQHYHDTMAERDRWREMCERFFQVLKPFGGRDGYDKVNDVLAEYRAAVEQS